MKKLLILLCIICMPSFAYAAFDATCNYPTSLDSTATNYFDKSYGDTVQHYDQDVHSDAIVKIETKVGIGSDTPVENEAFICTTTGTSAWGEVTPNMLFDNLTASTLDSGEDGYCLTYQDSDESFLWTSCGAGGGGDSITVNAVAATGGDFIDGDIEWTLVAPGTITATVACSGCISAGDIATGAVEADEIAADAVGLSEMADADHGDVSWATGVAVVENVQCTDCISDAEVVDTITASNYQVLDADLTDLATPASITSALFNFDAGLGVTGAFTVDNGATSGGYVDLYEDSDEAGNEYVRLIAPAIATSFTLTLPVDDGTANQLLKTDGSGVLSWADPSAATAAGADTNVQYNNAAALAGMTTLVYDATAGNPKVIDGAELLLGTDDDFNVGYDATDLNMNIWTTTQASNATDIGMVTIGLNSDNSGTFPGTGHAVGGAQQIFEIGTGGDNDADTNFASRFYVTHEGDAVAGDDFVATDDLIALDDVTVTDDITCDEISATGTDGSVIVINSLSTGAAWTLADSVAVASVYSGTTSLEETTAAADSGASIIGVYQEFDNFTCANVQDCLDEIDADLTSGGSGYADYIYDGDSKVEVVDTGTGYIQMYTDASSTVASAGDLRLADAFSMAWADPGSTYTYLTSSNGSLLFYMADAADYVKIVDGNLHVGNGTPGTAFGGEDAYITGTLEVDGAADFDGGLTAAGITADASATPAIYFDDVNDTGTQNAAIMVNCPTADNCDIELEVNSGADTLVPMIKIDTASDASLVQIGNTDSTDFAQFTEAGVMTWEGSSYMSDLELGAASDTTITRASAGVAQIEGVNIITNDMMDASSELYAIMDDETGSASGSPLLVFNVNPTLTGATLAGILADNDDMVFECDANNDGSNKYSFTDGSGAEVVSISEAGLITAAAGVNLGTSQALLGTTAITVGNNGQTVAVNSSDWDIDATGVATGFGNITSDGTITVGVGIDATGAVDIDYGSADITDHTFITDNTGDGEIVLPANSIGASEIDTIVESIAWIDDSLIADGTQCAVPTRAQINSGPAIKTVICADNDGSTIDGHVQMPDSWDGGTVTFELEYIQTAADTNVLNSDIACQCTASGETVGSTWNEQAIDDAAVSGSNIVDQTTSAAVTCAGTCAGGDMLYWRWQMDATGTDTAVGTLHITGVKMEYTSTVGD